MDRNRNPGEFSGRRLWKSILEALGLARGAGGMAFRIISWLVLLGVAPLADWLAPEHWLSLGRYALGLWVASVAVAFALSVQAIYSKQSVIDTHLDSERAKRREDRRRLLEGMLRILAAAERIRFAQQLPAPSTNEGNNGDPLTDARKQMYEAVSRYAETANSVHPMEALVHVTMSTQLRAALDHDRSLIAVRLPLGHLMTLFKHLALQDEKLFKDEIEAVRSGLELTRSNPKPQGRTDQVKTL